jgi:hypothetical protein
MLYLSTERSINTLNRYHHSNNMTETYDTIINIMQKIKTNENMEYYSILRDLVKTETDTLEYQLRALYYSYIGDQPFNIMKINNTIEVDEDRLDNYQLILPCIKPRLIMAFGPSASGKTTCSTEMIKKISLINPDFPTCFMTLDGGRFRKASNVFQMILKEAMDKSIDIAQHNIFPKVKNTIFKYYENQIAKYNTMISLYIPITLGKGIQSYSQYIDLTKDTDWIGIFIWQHKFNCIYDGEYRCNSCSKSGFDREKIEGKKYKLHRWESSMERGLTEVRKAKGGFYCIHNGGRQDSSMTLDYNNIISSDKYKINNDN